MSERGRTPKTIMISDSLWEVLEVMVADMGVEHDALVNQAIFTLARFNGYVVPGRTGHLVATSGQASSKAASELPISSSSVVIPAKPSSIVPSISEPAAGLPSSPPTPVSPDDLPDRRAAAQRMAAISADVDRLVLAHPSFPSPEEPSAHQSGEHAPGQATDFSGQASDDLQQDSGQTSGHMNAVTDVNPAMDAGSKTSSGPTPAANVADSSPDQSPIGQRQITDRPTKSRGPLDTQPVALAVNTVALPSLNKSRQALFVEHAGHQPTRVENDRFVIGRGKSCNLVLESQQVSREHVALIREADGIVIEDLNSSNGTWFDHTRIQRRRIEDGDIYMLGPERIRCFFGE